MTWELYNFGGHMKKIDIGTWTRRSHYEWFSSFADPTLAMNVRMDVTNLLDYCKRENVSSFAAIMYIVCRCANYNRAFRLRICGDDVVEIDYANVAYTVMTAENEFINCRAPMASGFKVYCDEVEANRLRALSKRCVQKQFNNTSIIDDIYCSCVPWVDFQSVVQPIPDKSADNKSIPRICWGKYCKQNDKVFMTLNITASHALVDGYNMSCLFNSIQQVFDKPELALREN